MYRYDRDGWDDAGEVIGFLVAVVLIVAAAWAMIWAVSGFINAVENAPPWCSVVTTTGEIESQVCPPGFNEGERIYWDNEKKTYAKVG
jgi:hypothetical protein